MKLCMSFSSEDNSIRVGYSSALPQTHLPIWSHEYLFGGIAAICVCAIDTFQFCLVRWFILVRWFGTFILFSSWPVEDNKFNKNIYTQSIWILCSTFIGFILDYWYYCNRFQRWWVGGSCGGSGGAVFIIDMDICRYRWISNCNCCCWRPYWRWRFVKW